MQICKRWIFALHVPVITDKYMSQCSEDHQDGEPPSNSPQNSAMICRAYSRVLEAHTHHHLCVPSKATTLAVKLAQKAVVGDSVMRCTFFFYSKNSFASERTQCGHNYSFVLMIQCSLRRLSDSPI